MVAPAVRREKFSKYFTNYQDIRYHLNVIPLEYPLIEPPDNNAAFILDFPKPFLIVHADVYNEIPASGFYYDIHSSSILPQFKVEILAESMRKAVASKTGLTPSLDVTYIGDFMGFDKLDSKKFKYAYSLFRRFHDRSNDVNDFYSFLNTIKGLIDPYVFLPQGRYIIKNPLPPVSDIWIPETEFDFNYNPHVSKVEYRQFPAPIDFTFEQINEFYIWAEDESNPGVEVWGNSLNPNVDEFDGVPFFGTSFTNPLFGNELATSLNNGFQQLTGFPPGNLANMENNNTEGMFAQGQIINPQKCTFYYSKESDFGGGFAPVGDIINLKFFIKFGRSPSPLPAELNFFNSIKELATATQLNNARPTLLVLELNDYE